MQVKGKLLCKLILQEFLIIFQKNGSDVVLTLSKVKKFDDKHVGLILGANINRQLPTKFVLISFK